VALSGCGRKAGPSTPVIEFTKVPPADVGGPDKVAVIEGRVGGQRAGQQIVLYARSGVWWVQPLANQPFTSIQADSRWKSDIHLGTEYAALLVNPAYRPPATLDFLPQPGGDVIAIATVKGQGESQLPTQTLRFGGYEWEARAAVSPRGGRINSYDPANAWTDANGALHLRIAKGKKGWTCAEVKLTRSLGYGSYVFVVRDTSRLESAAVFSMLTWDDLGAEQNHREMDIEISRWGDPGSQNAQYVVQPYYVPANTARFLAPAGGLTHVLRWEPGRASFKTVQGRDPEQGRVVFQHVFSSGVPAPGKETLHINLYVFGIPGVPLQNEAEVVVEKFAYFP
jgi:hypothetical protein